MKFYYFLTYSFIIDIYINIYKCTHLNNNKQKNNTPNYVSKQLQTHTYAHKLENTITSSVAYT